MDKQTAQAEAARRFAEWGIDDPTLAMLEACADMLETLADALADDPTLNDYAGEITSPADSAAAELDLSDVYASADMMRYDHGMGEASSTEENAKLAVWEVLTGIASTYVEKSRPAPSDVPWSKVPTTSHGDVLIGRSADDGFVYVDVRWDGSRLSISGHSDSSAGQCIDALEGLTPAPWYSARDVVELRRIWSRWHLNDMQAGCEHQRMVSDWCGVGMACPVCGYHYGSAWLREEVPADVLRFLARFDASRDDAVAQILRSDNPRDPSGQWSVYDVARAMVGRPDLTLDDMDATRAAIGRLCPDGGRYVGGTSGHLYHLMPDLEA